MKLGNPIPVAEGVLQIRAIGARVTVLAEGDEVILVDAGMKGSSRMIIESLEAIGLPIDMVKALVISHRHRQAAATERLRGVDIFLRRVRSIPVGYIVVMLATATVAVLIDFTMAILVGLVLSALVDATRSHSRELERLVSVPLADTEIWPDADPYESRVGLMIMPDRVSVASARELSRILGGDIRASQATIMDFGRTAYIDDTAAALIGKLINRKSEVVSGLHGEPAIMLAAFGTLHPDSCTQDVERAKAVVRVMFESESS